MAKRLLPPGFPDHGSVQTPVQYTGYHTIAREHSSCYGGPTKYQRISINDGHFARQMDTYPQSQTDNLSFNQAGAYQAPIMQGYPPVPYGPHSFGPGPSHN